MGTQKLLDYFRGHRILILKDLRLGQPTQLVLNTHRHSECSHRGENQVTSTQKPQMQRAKLCFGPATEKM